MSDYIPTEVLVEILVRLPARPLLRCSSVSKSWYSLITSTDFISMYTNFTTTNLRDKGSSDSTQLFVRHYSRTRGKEFFHMHADADHDVLWGGRQIFDCPIKSSGGGYLDIVGSCYGLVCLIDTGCQTRIQKNIGRPIVVWNPSARKSMTVRARPFVENGTSEQFLGFGFDFKTNDFKVVNARGVRRIPEMDFRLVGEVEIYALSEGLWRRRTVAPPQSLIKASPSRAYVNGNIHWIGHHDPVDVVPQVFGKSIVLVFDLGDEVFREMEIPVDFFNTDPICSISVVNLRDSLSLVQYFKEDPDHQSYHACGIWFMHKYGMAESWTKDYNICPPGGVGKMLWLWRKNEILLVTSCGELVSCDPECQKVVRIGTYGLPCSFYVDAYMESLVFTKYWLSSSTGTFLRRKNIKSLEEVGRAKRAKTGALQIG